MRSAWSRSSCSTTPTKPKGMIISDLCSVNITECNAATLVDMSCSRCRLHACSIVCSCYDSPLSSLPLCLVRIFTARGVCVHCTTLRAFTRFLDLFPRVLALHEDNVLTCQTKYTTHLVLHYCSVDPSLLPAAGRYNSTKW